MVLLLPMVSTGAVMVAASLSRWSPQLGSQDHLGAAGQLSPLGWPMWASSQHGSVRRADCFP